MKNESSTQVPKQALRKTDVMCNVYWCLYVISKLGMIYTIKYGKRNKNFNSL